MINFDERCRFLFHRVAALESRFGFFKSTKMMIAGCVCPLRIFYQPADSAARVLYWHTLSCKIRAKHSILPAFSIPHKFCRQLSSYRI